MHIRICFLFTLSFIVGCSTRAPIATYQHAIAQELNSDAGSFDAIFKVSNTNNEPIELLLYEYSVSVDGAHVFSGLHEANDHAQGYLLICGQLKVFSQPYIPLIALGLLR